MPIPPDEKQRKHWKEYMLGALVESYSEMTEKLLMSKVFIAIEKWRGVVLFWSVLSLSFSFFQISMERILLVTWVAHKLY